MARAKDIAWAKTCLKNIPV